MADPLTPTELDDALADLPAWTVVDGELRRELRFGDFAEAFAFMTRVAFAAEAMNHHPEWSNVYDRVIIGLRTHDADAITALDVELAGRIDAYAGS